MRTEDDVRHAVNAPPDQDALARLAAFVHDIGDISVVTSAPRHRRGYLVPLAAAAAVIVVVGGAVALAGMGNGSGHQSGGLSAYDRRPTWNLRVARVPGYTVTRINATSIGLATGSTTTVAAANSKRPEHGVITTCPLSFHSCSQPDNQRLSKVMIAGRPGYFFPGHRLDTSALPAGYARAHPWGAALKDVSSQPNLVWDAGHHTTVFLGGTFGFDPHARTYDNAAARKIVLRIAAAVSAGHHDATHLPFELQDLPGRVAPEGVRVENGGACGRYGTGPQSESDSLGEVFTVCRVATAASKAATVRAADRTESNSTNGVTRLEPEHPIVRDLADGTSLVIAVETDKRSLVSLRQARSLAANADVSPRLGVPTTWLVVD